MGGRRGEREPVEIKCVGCTAVFAAASRNRRLCDTCTGARANASARARWGRRSAEAGRKMRVGRTHKASVTCARCGLVEERTYTTIRPKFCPPCRGITVREQKREQRARRAAGRGS